ncbi:MAG: aspartate kinase, partial [Elusimicrobiota bacterium]
MKFGGSSVADPAKIQRAAARIAAVWKKTKRVAVVVSAPGDMTDDLLALASGVSKEPAVRELDMLLAAGEQVSIALLAMALRARGVPAVSLTGPQAGFILEPVFGNARVAALCPTRVRRVLAAGSVAVVAGFQGACRDGELATMGRGGSDLSAVALAAALGAGHCEIFTDVEGVYTADPRNTHVVKKLSAISYDEMLKLAISGAQVMQVRSI